MSTTPPPPGPPLTPNEPRGGDPTNPITWVIIGGARRSEQSGTATASWSGTIRVVAQ
ncbi:MAG: hypothetical protein JF886_12170 [Candidatus Dormibacteraeota bacterium]|uniref:Uncharacterized protein n=1 Tax=Candidatus Aeolococcus gillhamiae TaxID=3127015 RepID=A0A934K1K3_9BACT|nr:hypothetical protein [Candidatus Dormibacteraeota bacterium]